MCILLGLVIIVAGIAYAIYTTKAMDKLNLEVQSIQTSKIADTKEIIDSLSLTDSNYRHYVELKGDIFTKKEVTAPFTEKKVAYYENATYSVTEITEEYKDSNGNRRTRIRKREEKLANEHSVETVYLRDDSFADGIVLDIESFGSKAEFQDGCDRMERENSDWMRRHNHFMNTWGRGTGYGARFLGYRLVEKVLLQNQPMYVLGEMYKQGNQYFVGCSRLAKNASKLTYKSEDEVIASNHSSKKMSWVIAAVAVVAGIVVIGMGVQ